MATTATADASRSAQRRAARAARVGRIRWDRVGRLALLGMLGMILLLYISPAKHWVEQSGTRAAQQEELVAAQCGERRPEAQGPCLQQPGIARAGGAAPRHGQGRASAAT